MSTLLSYISQETINDFITDYQNGLSVAELRNKYHLTAHAYTTLKKHCQLPKRTGAINPLIIQQAVQDFVSGMLLKDVCAKYGICTATVYRYMKNNNIVYKNGHGRKYHCDESFFETIDNEKKAYWLGFIFGDGCVAYSEKTCTAPNRLSFNLSQRDRCQLEDFNHDLNSNFPIVDFIPRGTFAEYPMSRLYINSIKICRDLVSYGCVPNKTRNLHFPYDAMSQSLYCHFIRGIVDADGYFGNRGFTITKYIPFLEEIMYVLQTDLSLKHPGYIYAYKDRASEIGDLRYHAHEDLLQIFNYLYSDATVFLKRKYDKAYSALFS